MPVTSAFRAYALEQIGRVVPVTSRAMFGGVGIYSNGLFFALMDDDTLYLKVDDSNRADFEAQGMGPFRPYGDDTHVMQYYELPAELLEEPEALRPWVEKAIEVARRKKRR
jgi:DNA transformation protein and related proteins